MTNFVSSHNPYSQTEAHKSFQQTPQTYQPINLSHLFKLGIVSFLLLLNPELAAAKCPVDPKLDAIARTPESLTAKQLQLLTGPKGLGIEEPLSSQSVKKAYRRRALVCHPDHNTGKDAEAQFVTLANIYEKLTETPKTSSFQSSYESKEKASSLSPVEKAQQKIRQQLHLRSDTQFNAIHQTLTDLDLDELSLEDAVSAIVQIVSVGKVPFEELNKAHPARLEIILKHSDETISLLKAGASFAHIAKLHRGDLNTLFKNYQHTCSRLNQGHSLEDLFGAHSSETFKQKTKPLSSPEETKQEIIRQLQLPPDTEFNKILEVLTQGDANSLSLENGVDAVVRIVKAGGRLEDLNKAHTLRLPIYLNHSKKIASLLKAGASLNEILALHRNKLVIVLQNSKATCSLLKNGLSFSSLTELSSSEIESLLTKES